MWSSLVVEFLLTCKQPFDPALFAFSTPPHVIRVPNFPCSAKLSRGEFSCIIESWAVQQQPAAFHWPLYWFLQWKSGYFHVWWLNSFNIVSNLSIQHCLHFSKPPSDFRKIVSPKIPISWSNLWIQQPLHFTTPPSDFRKIISKKTSIMTFGICCLPDYLVMNIFLLL